MEVAYFSYIINLKSALGKINSSSEHLSLKERYELFKFAADFALALTAKGTCWSKALKRQAVAKHGKGFASPKSESSMRLYKRVTKTCMEKIRKVKVPQSILSCSFNQRLSSLGRVRLKSCGAPKTKTTLIKHKLFQRQLQHVIPGGNQMDTSLLLQETASYMMFLEMQVKALASLLQP